MLTKFTFAPGIVKDDPPLTAEGFWQDGKNVRFYRGKPEKVKGWEKFSTSQLSGVGRSMRDYTNLSGTRYLSIGTDKKLYAYEGETQFNITPYGATGTGTAMKLSTTNGLPTVTVTHTAHGRNIGDTIYFQNQNTAVGGITLSGQYTVVTTPTSNTYTITAGSNATSTQTESNITIDYQYELAVGNTYGASANGWGSNGFGLEAWGTPRTAGSIQNAPRTWSLEPFGDDLLAVPYGGRLYYWSGNTSNRAALETDSPTRINFMFVTPERFVVALGTHTYPADTFNPMLVRWADQESISDWTPSATNTSGEYILSAGTQLMGGCASVRQNLIWSDSALYAMRYLGDTQYIYGFDLIGTNCGLAGPHAFTQKDGMAFWMSPQGAFFMYDGGAARSIPCSVKKYVFDNINTSQYRLVCCGLNSLYNEIIWYYPSGSSNEINSYVAYNYVEQCWTIGDIARTAYTDKNLFSNPIAISTDGYVYYHEMGYNADGAAISAYIESAPFDIADGEHVMNVNRIVPDVELDGNMDMVLTMRRWQNDVNEQVKSLTFSDTSTKVDTRAQGRVAKIRLGSDAANEWWRLGDIRMDMKPIGRR